jgi:hypothetical protein
MCDSNKAGFDMATAVKAAKPFQGSETEDVDTWIRDVLLVAEVAGLSERETVKFIVCH